MPPAPGLRGIGDSLLCSYDLDVEAGEDVCRSQVVPETGSELTLDFSCPQQTEIRWRAESELDEDVVKQWVCDTENIPSIWTDVDAATEGKWPICGE